MRKLIVFLTGFLSLIIIFILPCYGEECPGDINCDGVVDGSDLADFAIDYGKPDCPACIPAPIPVTGETTCYDESGTVIDCTGTGQDGEYQKGKQWPYPRFTDNENGTVTDYLTGLIWLRDANCFGEITWSNALASCNALAAGQCGLSDVSVPGNWRLPNIRELLSLVDFGNYLPALPSGHPFVNVQRSFYWSSTTYPGWPEYVWRVPMGYGDADYDYKYHYEYVWPVRIGN